MLKVNSKFSCKRIKKLKNYGDKNNNNFFHKMLFLKLIMFKMCKKKLFTLTRLHCN